jgi:MoaA/NifB/PqqE/SkfB family radical SAM enzyme
MIATRGNVENKVRNNLGEVLPLDTPYSLFIDVCNICNFKCRYCAIQIEDINSRWHKQAMSFELFKKIADDIKAFKSPLKMLRLGGNGEPLLNKDLPKMIRYARELGISEHIETVTNGSLFSEKMIDEIIDAGIDRIRISIQGINAEAYRKMSNSNIDWDKFINNLTYLYNNRKQCEIYIKTVNESVKSIEEQNKFYSIFERICDIISIENIVPVWAGYDKIHECFTIDDKAGLRGRKLKDVYVCPFPFYSCIINPDGQVTVCCMDWKRGIVIGDASANSIKEIWHGEEHHNFLFEMLKNGRRKCHEICSGCDYPEYDAIDDVDDYIDILLNKYYKIGES